MKILVIRLSSTGGIILSTPVLRCIKTQVENADVHFLTSESHKVVTEANPYIDRFFYLDKYLPVLIEDLKEVSYDLIIDLQNNKDSIAIRKALKKKAFSIKDHTLEKNLLTTLHLNFLPKKHIAIRNLDLLKTLGVKDDGKGLDYFVPEKDIVTENDLPTSHVLGFICIAIGASHNTKKLPVHTLQELCKKTDHPVILLGGNEDKETGDEIASADPIKIYNSCGKFNLNETADLIKKSKLLITHDTGLQYIAYAFNKKVIVIWGSTSPAFMEGPFYGSRFLSVQNELPYENVMVPGRWCRPCSKSGKDKCPLGHFKCMEKQDIDGIVKKINERLK